MAKFIGFNKSDTSKKTQPYARRRLEEERRKKHIDSDQEVLTLK